MAARDEADFWQSLSGSYSGKTELDSLIASLSTMKKY